MAEELEDAELVRCAKAGDQPSMEALLVRHFDYIFGCCFRILRERDRAEDALQETLFKAAHRIASFNEESSFKTWITTIAKNVSLNMVRGNGTPPEPFGPGSEVADSGGRDEWLVDLRLDLDAALDRVTDNFRDAVILHYLCELKYEEIATLLDIELNTVRSRIHRGVAELRQIFGDLSVQSEV
jgi:RNA polymerase sigma-70 factor, ECF subfamily